MVCSGAPRKRRKRPLEENRSEPSANGLAPMQTDTLNQVDEQSLSAKPEHKTKAKKQKTAIPHRKSSKARHPKHTTAEVLCTSC
jgi:hypothetical protein